VSSRWPAHLWLVRHGQSAGNVARDEAHASGADRIALPVRDVDVPLSKLGEQQACALGRWMSNLPAEKKPDIVLSSPYLRSRRTAELIIECHGLVPGVGDPVIDERLREKEFGILDGLTTRGIAAVHPDQVGFRKLLGKFYHRAPGGESWVDVILRLRSTLDTLALHYAGRRVMIVSHQVVILCFRYLLENLDEQRILAIDRAGDVANCGVTEYSLASREDGSAGSSMVLLRYNFTAPLERAGAPVTTAPDPKTALR
jgi:2,3-bisphosphoglycerate-dependent phosphoglycerate mutase